MDIDETEKLFPGVKDKIAAPKKQSAFAKEKQAAEAKKREDEAANAALLKTFEASFDVEDDQREPPQHGARGRTQALGQRGYDNSNGRRDAWSHGRKSGPGSLGPAPGPQQPPSLKRKRALDEMRELEAARREEAMLDQRDSNTQDQRNARSQQHDEQDSFVPRPTIHLASLPPNMTSEQLKAILSPMLNVHSIRFHPPTGPQADRRKCMSAVATLASETTPKQVDTAVNQLRDRYVGCGFIMTAARIAPSTNLPVVGREQPFGAQNIQHQTSLRAAPPPGDYNRIAPPDSYDRKGSMLRETEVNIDKVLDLATVRAVHTIADRLLCETDHIRALELEALLMSLPEVQSDERFAFLYDSKSLAGLYYRYCLWGPEDERRSDDTTLASERLFSDVYTRWRAPSRRMPFPKLTDLSQAIDDPDYASSDEESDEEQQSGPVHDVVAEQAKARISITPLQRARLTYLLARLPTSTARLRRGDVARVTNFVISHAVDGIDEIVDMLLLNVERPFMLSGAAKYDQDEDAPMYSDDEIDEEEYDPECPPAVEEGPSAMITDPSAKAEDSREVDLSSAKMVALYVLSDILGAIGSAEGAKNAWKYRQLIEAGLKHQKTFERLGNLDRELGWGRMKAEQWKRKIAALLDIWEKSSSFGSDVIQSLKSSFNQEVSPDNDDTVVTTDQTDSSGIDKMPKWMKSFKKIDQDIESMDDSVSRTDAAADAKAAPIKLLGHDMPVQTLTREVKTSSDEQDNSEQNKAVSTLSSTPAERIEKTAQLISSDLAKAASSAAPRKRMRAEDMFADSDGE